MVSTCTHDYTLPVRNVKASGSHVRGSSCFINADRSKMLHYPGFVTPHFVPQPGNSLDTIIALTHTCFGSPPHLPKSPSYATGSPHHKCWQDSVFLQYGYSEEVRPGIRPHQPGIRLSPLLRVIRTPCGVRALRAMTSRPPVPFTTVTEKNSHAEGSSYPQSESVYPTGVASLGHFFRHRTQDKNTP